MMPPTQSLSGLVWQISATRSAARSEPIAPAVISASATGRLPGAGPARPPARLGRRPRGVLLGDLAQQPQDAVAALDRRVEPKVELRHVSDHDPLRDLVAQEAGRAAQRGQARLLLVVAAEDRDEDLGVAEVRGRLDLGDRDQTGQARVLELPADQRAQLVAQQLVDALDA